MSHTSFIPRRLQVRLTLHNGSFAGGGNSKIIDNLAIKANIEKLGPPDFAKASVEIYGMALNEIEQITSLAMDPLSTTRDYINIYAGNDEMGLSEVFAGSIISAHGDFSDCPEHKLTIEAEVGFWGRVIAQGPNVINGTQPVSSFIATQAAAAGLRFANEGVTSTVKDCVFNGTPIQQAQQAANQVGADLLIDDEEMVLLPREGHRQGNAVLLNRDSGLLGFPSLSGNGIECKCIYNPALRFAGLFILESVVPKASGTWRIIKLAHKLSANDPGDGSWESSLTGYYPHLSSEVGKTI